MARLWLRRRRSHEQARRDCDQEWPGAGFAGGEAMSKPGGIAIDDGSPSSLTPQGGHTSFGEPLPPLVAPNIARIAPYEPGKPLEELERELGAAWPAGGAIKLASNENPLGPSPLAL